WRYGSSAAGLRLAKSAPRGALGPGALPRRMPDVDARYGHPCADLLWLIDRIEHAAVGKVGFLRVAPAAERIVHGVELELRKLRGQVGRHLVRARTVEVLRGNLLALFAVQEVQIRVSELARAVPVDHLVDHRHRRFGQNA